MRTAHRTRNAPTAPRARSARPAWASTRRACAGILGSLALGLTLGLVAPAHAADSVPDAVPASGSLALTTANGILPTWDAAGLRLTGVSPGKVITNASGVSADIWLPIVARFGSANYAAGGFRLTNTKTGTFVNCATPAIDTKAMLLDCSMRDGTNARLFRIEKADRPRVSQALGTTQVSNMMLRVTNQDAADFLNDELDVNTFSTYVTVFLGDLTVGPRS